jgi:AsmA protein
MKILRYALFAFGGLAILVGAVAAYVIATFNPNDYKPQIMQAVKEKTQRTLKLEGDIRLSLFPTLGAKLGKATLSERGSEREFAGVDELVVAVKLIPLFSREVVVDAVEVRNLRANLVRGRDGKTNFDDLAAGGEKPTAGPPARGGEVKVDIARVAIENARLTYADQTAGTRYTLSKVNLTTGRIASGVPTRVDLALALQSDEPKLNLETSLKTRLTFDIDRQRYALEGLELDAKGAAAGVSNLAASVKGDVDARPAAGEFSGSKLAISVSGKQAGADLKVKLDLPRLDVIKEKVSGQINVSADLQQEGMTVKAKLASPLAGSVEAQRFELSKIAAQLSVNHPGLPKNPVDATVNGSLQLDLAKQTAALVFATRLDESNINGRAGLAKFAPPFYTFDVNIDRLDADRYLPEPAPAGKGPSKAPGKEPEKPFDLSWLKDLNASGTLRIGSLKVTNVKSSNVRLDVKAANGRLDLNPIAANLYEGSLAGALAVNAAAMPSFAVKQNLSGVAIGPLLKDFADNDSLEGRGNITLDVTTRGNTVTALKKALNGATTVKLADGAVKGIDVAGSIRSAKAKLGALRGEQTQAADKAQKTDFSELTATFSIKNGVAHNSDLSLKSPLLRVGGAGEINLGEDRLDYVVKAAVVGSTKGQGGREADELKGITVPVRVSGPLAAPSFKLDFGAMVTDTAKQKVEEAVKDRVEKQLGDRLKGLFGR